MGFNERKNIELETKDRLSASIENWKWYIGNEIEDPDFDPKDLIVSDQDEAVRRIQRMHRGSYFEKDKFKTLTDVSVWIDEHPEYGNENDNCEIVVGKTGVHLVVNPTEHVEEGIYFKDRFWSGGEWYKMNNSVDIVVFTHIFSKLTQILEKD
jgi:hypothetical protein